MTEQIKKFKTSHIVTFSSTLFLNQQNQFHSNDLKFLRPYLDPQTDLHFTGLDIFPQHPF